jgi:hypothetical protein
MSSRTRPAGCASRALRNSALGDLLAGTIDAEQLAQRLDCEPGEIAAMLAELGIDQLLPAAR